MSDQPIHEFTSHVQGKNAKVRIYPDRIEWSLARNSKAKAALGIMTVGTSLLATGIKGKGSAGTEMIPMRSVSSITTRRDGMLNTIVSVITSGNTIDFRVSHSEAEQVKATISRLMMAL